MNPLYNQLGNSLPSNMQSMINQFNQFRKTFTGDPRQQVQSLLDSGKMTQEQFNQYSQMADQMLKMLK